MGVAGGFTAELPKLRVLAATTQIWIWRQVGEAGDGCTGVDVTAAFEPRNQDKCGLAGRSDGVVVGDVGEEASDSFRAGAVEAQRLKALDSPRPKAPGSFRHRQRMHAKLG